MSAARSAFLFCNSSRSPVAKMTADGSGLLGTTGTNASLAGGVGTIAAVVNTTVSPPRDQSGAVAGGEAPEIPERDFRLVQRALERLNGEVGLMFKPFLLALRFSRFLLTQHLPAQPSERGCGSHGDCREHGKQVARMLQAVEERQGALTL